MVPVVVVFVGVGIEDMLRVRVQVEQFFHGGTACRIGFCLVELDHRLEIFRGFLVETENLDKLGGHAGADLFPSENIGEVTSRLGETQHVANPSTGELRVALDSCGLVFFQILAEVRKLIYVYIVFHKS